MRGRKSGKPRSTPITVFSGEGKRYVLGGSPGADWVLNARAAEVAKLSRDRRSEEVLPRAGQMSLRLWPDGVRCSGSTH